MNLLEWANDQMSKIVVAVDEAATAEAEARYMAEMRPGMYMPCIDSTVRMYRWADATEPSADAKDAYLALSQMASLVAEVERRRDWMCRYEAMRDELDD